MFTKWYQNRILITEINGAIVRVKKNLKKNGNRSRRNKTSKLTKRGKRQDETKK